MQAISTIQDFQGYGRAVRQGRVRKGWTQEQVGKECGITGDMISKIERGVAGPKARTYKQLERVLGIPSKRFLNKGPGGQVMDGLQELTDQVRLLTEKVEKGQGPVNPALPDVSELTGSKAQIVKAVSDLQNRVGELENGTQNPNPAEDELEPEKETPDEVIDKLITEHEDLKKEGIFKDFGGGIFDGESAKERTFKAQLYVDICNACDDLELDAFEVVEKGFLSGSTTRAEVVRDVLVEFCTDDINRDEIRKELEKYLKPANPGDDEGEDQSIFD